MKTNELKNYWKALRETGVDLNKISLKNHKLEMEGCSRKFNTAKEIYDWLMN